MNKRRPTLLFTALLAVLGAGVGRAGSLVGYWSFDEGQGGVVADLSGNGNDGTVNGTPVWIDGRLGAAVQLNGTTDFIDCGNGASLNITDKLTLSAWVTTVDAGEAGEQLGGQNHYISKYDSYGIKHRTNLLIFWIYDNGWQATRIAIDDAFNGEWHHCVGTYDGSVLKTYVDGKLEGELAHEGRITLNTLNVLIGNNPANDTEKLEGAIDEVRIYNRELSASHVQDLFAGSAPSFAQAEKPEPEDGAKGVATPLLMWTAGEDAVLHNLYLGTEANLTEADFQGQLAMALYWYAAGLAPGQRYYWRVDEVQADGTTTTGKVWSFTAASPQAYDPRPRDGAGWLDPNTVTLTWEFGTDAQTHDVHFSTDQAAVEAGAADALVGNQVLNTYEPGPLEKDTAYYWRIDEHSAAGQVHTGEVWAFTTAGGPDDGVQAEYFANPDLLGAPAVIRTESRIDFLWPDGAVEGLNSPAPGIPTNNYSARWSAELHVAHSGAYRFVINVNNSGRLWLDDRLLIDRWPNDGTIPEYTTPSVELVAARAYSLVMEWNKYNPTGLARLEWIDPFGDRRVIPSGHLQLPLRANRPGPSAGQVDVVQTPILGWQSGYKATGHDVYFGTDAEAVAAADTTTAGIYRGRRALDDTTFDPGPLEWDQSYHWRIDEVNATEADSPWTGYVWSFTTADFLVVEDFERYTDNIEAGEAIFQTWIDGVDNGTGSYVGYEVSSGGTFGETAIVHSGLQSMPLDYNNVPGPYYSETERTWATPQDWTINGVDTLTMYFRGNAGNDPEHLYIALEDGAGKIGVVTHADPEAARATRWTEWKVPLTAFSDAGVNVTAVKKMAIGLGDRDAPLPGGAGRLFFDDLRVTRSELGP